MISHIHFGVADFHRSQAFYAPIMAALGFALRFYEPEKCWAAWQSADRGRPLFIIGLPFDGAAHDAGNGQMVAFTAPSRASVDQVYALALAAGGQDEGSPGLRPHYHEHYYGAYFRDPDLNKVCVVCHDPQDGNEKAGTGLV